MTTCSDELLQERQRWKSEVDEILRGKGLSEEQAEKLRRALFFAKWSEVRKDAATMLQQYDGLQAHDARKLFHSIMGEMDGSEEMPWQAVHGALLGINAILGKIGDLDSDAHEKTKNWCLRLQGNSQLLVREQVHKVLLYLFTRSDEVERLHLLDGFLNTVIRLLQERLAAAEMVGFLKTPSPSASRSPTKGFHFDNNSVRSPRPNSNIERTAYVLEGTLEVIHSIFEGTPELFQLLLKTQASSIKNQQTEVLESVFVSMELPAFASNSSGTDFDGAPFYMAIARCLADFSSTVRQAAAQALLALVDRCNAEKRSGSTGDHNVAQSISKTIYKDLTARLKTASLLEVESGVASVGSGGCGYGQRQGWLELEACLLVSEGLVKNRIEAELDSLMEGTNTADGKSEEEAGGVSHIHEYLRELHSALGPCVLSPAFEIKRAGTQVVPLLARLLCLRYPRLLFESPSIGGAGAVQGVLGAIYAFYWVSEVTKASQHMREVVAGAPNVADGGVLGHGHPEAHVMWALEVAGRLGEEENKMHFRHRLRALVPPEGPMSAKHALEDSLATITQGLRQHLPRLLDRWQASLVALKEEQGDSRAVVALDVAEACALAACAVCGDATSTTEEVQFSVLEAWTQRPELIAHLLRTTSGRYRDRYSPSASTDAATGHSGMSATPVLIIPSVADPGMDPSALLTPRRRSQATPDAGLALGSSGSPRSVLTAGIGLGGVATTPAVSPRSANATNRHFCELVAPVLPMLSMLHARCHGTSTTEQLLHLLTVGQLCVHWLSCCLSDAQFLERRQHVRNGLCAALVTFLQKIHDLCKVDALPDNDLQASVRAETEVLEQLVVGAAHIATDQIVARGGSRGSSAHDALMCGALARSARLIGLSHDMLASMGTSTDGGSVGRAHASRAALRAQLVTDLNKVKGALGPSSAHKASPARRVIGASCGDARDQTAGTSTSWDIGGDADDKVEEGEEDEFSDWDESSEELNISVNSISAIREDEEAEHCLQEIERTVAYANNTTEQ